MWAPPPRPCALLTASSSRKSRVDGARIEKAVLELIRAIGEDPQREGLRGTPGRVAEMYAELFRGMGQDPREELKTDRKSVV